MPVEVSSLDRYSDGRKQPQHSPPLKKIFVQPCCKYITDRSLSKAVLKMASTATFKINLPSIPGKPIRLRVQDLAQKGFLVRQQRFKSDKSKLVGEFTNTFDNLHRPPTPPEPQPSDKESRSTVASYHTESPNFRYVMPQYKNVLMEVLKREESELIKVLNGQQSPPRRQTRAISHVGHTQNPLEPYISVQERLWEYRLKQKQRREFVQDYYYIGKKLEDEQRERIRRQREKPSAVFLNESRGRIRQRAELQDESLGPGYYPSEPDLDEQEEKRKEEIKRLSSVRPRLPERPSLQKESINLKKHTAKIFVKHKIELKKQQVEEEDAEPRQQRKPRQDHMFVRDDRDRFGDQIFPIVLKTNVPGPGAYEVVETIEDKARKINTLEEQRKLLKEWFNQ